MQQSSNSWWIEEGNSHRWNNKWQRECWEEKSFWTPRNGSQRRGAVQHVLRDFQAKPINFVQIGLGTNSTCLQNLRAGVAGSAEWAKDIAWLLSATHAEGACASGVSVEPMAKHVRALREHAENSQSLALIQAAIGEVEDEAEVWGLDPDTVDDMLNQVSWYQRLALRSKLEYILNMSCVGRLEKRVAKKCDGIYKKYGVFVNLVSCSVDVWSWRKLVEACNFEGCELLIVDTEGYDAKILRSMLKYCREYANAWPSLIQFETMGHCDQAEGAGTEWSVIHELEIAGYVLIGYSKWNSHLVWSHAPQRSRKLKSWLEEWICSKCWRRNAFPYITNATGTHCRQCCDLPIYSHSCGFDFATASEYHEADGASVFERIEGAS